MKILEMQQREPFMDTLLATLASGWSEQHQREIAVLPFASGIGSIWVMNPVLNAFYVPAVSKMARRFLRVNSRYSLVPWQIPAQWAIKTFATSTIGLNFLAKPFFRVSSLPGQSDLLVVPGNQRVRVFDFAQSTCRVILKWNFSPQTMLTEIRVRATEQDALFPKITEWSETGNWFEEPILDAFALPRCPPWLSWREYEQEAFRLIDEWLAASRVETDVEDRIESLYGSITGSLEKITSRLHFDSDSRMLDWTRRLGSQARSLGKIQLADTHGDFQPGNILVQRHSEKVFITDWEHCSQRFHLYDYLVYELRSRWPDGLSERLGNLLLGKSTTRVRGRFVDDFDWRKAALALFLLEDLNWVLAENTTGPYTQISHGLRTYCQELDNLASTL